MKEIILVRHAKSSWDNRGLRDIDRPLNRRGEHDAPIMGERLADSGVDVERIVISPAERATLTAEAIARELNFDWDLVQIEEALYGAGSGDWLNVVLSQPEHVDTILFVGHNPGLTDFLNSFLAEPLPNVPTCGVARLRFQVDDWSELEAAGPTEVHYSIPKRDGWRKLE